MVGKVRRDVRLATNERQVPWESSALEGRFYFRPETPVAPPPPTPSPPVASTAVTPDPRRAPVTAGPAPIPQVAAPQPSPAAPAAPVPNRPANQQTALVIPLIPPPRDDTRGAAVCRLSGLNFSGNEIAISSTMVVSRNGPPCTGKVSLSSFLPVALWIVQQPRHGQLTVSGADSVAATYTYRPEPGYAGPDSFAIQTGSLGRVRQTFTVTVQP